MRKTLVVVREEEAAGSLLFVGGMLGRRKGRSTERIKY